MEDREKLIQERIKAEEAAEIVELKGVKQRVWDILTKEKKYDPSEIEIDPEYRLKLSDSEAAVSIDFVVTFPSASFMVIKCSSSSIESWERYVVSFARVVKDYQIPYAVVTDGDNARIVDALAGTIVSESIKGLFERKDAINKLKDFKKIPCPANRLEKEKRIMYAFESIKCPTVK